MDQEAQQPKKRNKKKQFNDLGLGYKLTSANRRFINKDGSFNVIRKGKNRMTPYQYLTHLSWPGYLLIVVIYFTLVNAFFATLFLTAGIEYLQGVESGTSVHNFGEAFFFSVQTFTTVGYGAIHPVGTASNIIASLDALTGLLSVALATGLSFARFAKAQISIVFSEHSLISPYQNGTSFQFRVANALEHSIVDLEVNVTMTWITTNTKGIQKRKFKRLPLERDKVYLFPVNWTIVHPIDEDSPLWGKTQQELLAQKAEFLISLKAFDENYDQVIYTNSSYTADELIWDKRYQLMYREHEEGIEFDLDLLDETEDV